MPLNMVFSRPRNWSRLKPYFRDAEMTIKIIFERSSQKGGRQGVRKRVNMGTHLEILLSG